MNKVNRIRERTSFKRTRFRKIALPLLFVTLVAFAVFSVPLVKMINQKVFNLELPSIEESVPVVWGIILVIAFIANLFFRSSNASSSSEDITDDKHTSLYKATSDNTLDSSSSIETEFSETYGYSLVSDSAYNGEFFIDELEHLHEDK